MTIEEKAKAYDEAIKYANCLINERCKEGTDGSFHRADLHKMFPQLKESEDEIVIAALKSGINGLLKKEYHLKGIGGISFDRINAWLEKQAEQNPVVKIQLGKKYKCIASPRYSTFMKGKIYKPEDKFLCSLMNFCSDCFEPIEDDEQKSTDKVEPKFKVGDWLQYRNAKPFFVEEITKQGYVDGDSCLPFNWENEIHLWSIQDAKDGDVLALNGEVFIYAHRKQLYSVAVTHCFVDSDGCFYLDGNFGYIEKENPIQPATKEQRDLLFQKMKEAGYEWNAEKKELKKIEQNTAWSEKDKNNIIYLDDLVGYQSCLSKDKKKEYHDWLYSLKERVGKFDDGYKVGFSAAKYNQWKPSEEQITWLYRAADVARTDSRMKQILNGLLSDLKKLVEE